MRFIAMRFFRVFLNRLFSRRLSRFARDNNGVSAVEFALLLPVMVGLYSGCADVAQGVSIDRKVTLTARTVADLVAQVSTINNTGLDAVLGASTKVLAPYYSATNATITISGVNIDKNGGATIAWSKSKNGKAHACGASVNVPAALRTPNTFLVWGETTYNYEPLIGFLFKKPFDLTDQIFMRPRLSETVTYSGC